MNLFASRTLGTGGGSASQVYSSHLSNVCSGLSFVPFKFYRLAINVWRAACVGERWRLCRHVI